ncbi:bifunctional adenosylcobinamide kinase/adenosylcobinamide-phosphate guanylyltransferase [Roseivirga pacifica]|uniref:bifunctional adenosylcobinamide kinase/adenosylcobinamide-phosphate guanylyltransferase n=1 Tax=Roseivirga pacifica TaxID=1267423 RepID=UPI00209472A1|nr:bifunctional adenosylcobinamide kinase/adenosylcobinamide-phosphate guanylyltransferase [Roseivirga pacifica]MCO6359559.1 adenosylcobinamide kinase/adenosylcobinamide phosphate guanyltransferase [Roseivirga pacifica]MCO6366929.1 adenosylcobinamide kinase/adenosylcobinamide phosphate guanyltransferase [Roseivirga pacifica]MCO6370539.1 adenosylcobinamide kinase/adenosylcobinamide phosphate guanyltransferase [Roseivirga pacifica]MCO6374586.1 adenosylcobinamide kinase/adenosylcobinamide phosphat
MIYYITGGQRSGKSSYGQKLALSLSDNPVYLATSRHWDGDYEKRIERHKADRDERWENIEEEKYLSTLTLEGKVVLVDCVTLWLTNFFVDTKNDVDECLRLAKQEFAKLIEQQATFIFISNEVGMGTHAHTEVGRKFTDLQGWMNQFIAARADEAWLMVSGIPMKLK